MFHPFGGACDIIVVQQEDGSYKTAPWYVRFGKFQGVLKRREKIVSIEVNDVEAGFHMYLDTKGEAFFLRDDEDDSTEIAGQLEYLKKEVKLLEGPKGPLLIEYSGESTSAAIKGQSHGKEDADGDEPMLSEQSDSALSSSTSSLPLPISGSAMSKSASSPSLNNVAAVSSLPSSSPTAEASSSSMSPPPPRLSSFNPSKKSMANGTSAVVESLASLSNSTPQADVQHLTIFPPPPMERPSGRGASGLPSPPSPDPLLFMSPVEPPSPVVTVTSTLPTSSPLLTRPAIGTGDSRKVVTQFAAAIDSTATLLAESSAAAVAATAAKHKRIEFSPSVEATKDELAARHAEAGIAVFQLQTATGELMLTETAVTTPEFTATVGRLEASPSDVDKAVARGSLENRATAEKTAPAWHSPATVVKSNSAPPKSSLSPETSLHRSQSTPESSPQLLPAAVSGSKSRLCSSDTEQEIEEGSSVSFAAGVEPSISTVDAGSPAVESGTESEAELDPKLRMAVDREMAWREVVENAAQMIKDAPSTSKEAFELARRKEAEAKEMGAKRGWGWFGWRSRPLRSLEASPKEKLLESAGESAGEQTDKGPNWGQKGKRLAGEGFGAEGNEGEAVGEEGGHAEKGAARSAASALGQSPSPWGKRRDVKVAKRGEGVHLSAERAQIVVEMLEKQWSSGKHLMGPPGGPRLDDASGITVVEEMLASQLQEAEHHSGVGLPGEGTHEKEQDREQVASKDSTWDETAEEHMGTELKVLGMTLGREQQGEVGTDAGKDQVGETGLAKNGAGGRSRESAEREAKKSEESEGGKAGDVQNVADGEATEEGEGTSLKAKEMEGKMRGADVRDAEKNVTESTLRVEQVDATEEKRETRVLGSVEGEREGEAGSQKVGVGSSTRELREAGGEREELVGMDMQQKRETVPVAAQQEAQGLVDLSGRQEQKVEGSQGFGVVQGEAEIGSLEEAAESSGADVEAAAAHRAGEEDTSAWHESTTVEASARQAGSGEALSGNKPEPPVQASGQVAGGGGEGVEVGEGSSGEGGTQGGDKVREGTDRMALDSAAEGKGKGKGAEQRASGNSPGEASKVEPVGPTLEPFKCAEEDVSERSATIPEGHVGEGSAATLAGQVADSNAAMPVGDAQELIRDEGSELGVTVGVEEVPAGAGKGPGGKAEGAVMDALERPPVPGNGDGAAAAGLSDGADEATRAEGQQGAVWTGEADEEGVEGGPESKVRREGTETSEEGEIGWGTGVGRWAEAEQSSQACPIHDHEEVVSVSLDAHLVVATVADEDVPGGGRRTSEGVGEVLEPPVGPLASGEREVQEGGEEEGVGMRSAAEEEQQQLKQVGEVGSEEAWNGGAGLETRAESAVERGELGQSSGDGTEAKAVGSLGAPPSAALEPRGNVTGGKQASASADTGTEALWRAGAGYDEAGQDDVFEADQGGAAAPEGDRAAEASGAEPGVAEPWTDTPSSAGPHSDEPRTGAAVASEVAAPEPMRSRSCALEPVPTGAGPSGSESTTGEPRGSEPKIDKNGAAGQAEDSSSGPEPLRDDGSANGECATGGPSVQQLETESAAPEPSSGGSSPAEPSVAGVSPTGPSSAVAVTLKDEPHSVVPSLPGTSPQNRPMSEETTAGETSPGGLSSGKPSPEGRLERFHSMNSIPDLDLDESGESFRRQSIEVRGEDEYGSCSASFVGLSELATEDDALSVIVEVSELSRVASPQASLDVATAEMIQSFAEETAVRNEDRRQEASAADVAATSAVGRSEGEGGEAKGDGGGAGPEGEGEAEGKQEQEGAASAAASGEAGSTMSSGEGDAKPLEACPEPSPSSEPSTGLELSLCKHLLHERMGVEAAAAAFEAHRVGMEQFMRGANNILNNDRLVARVAGRYYPWSAAAPRLVGMLAFGQVVPPIAADLDGAMAIEKPQPKPKPTVERKAEKNKEKNGTNQELALVPGGNKGGWTLWPFGGGRRSPQAGGGGGDAGKSNTPVIPPEMMLAAAGAALENPLTKELLYGVNGFYARPRKHRVRALVPTSEQLATLPLQEGKNRITFSFTTRMLGKQQVECSLYVWRYNTRVVISDVDGTITKSDVLGQVMPLVGRDWSQVGVARLFSAIRENGYELMFLSARAITQAYLTRSFLFNLRQEGSCLPEGPVVISPDGLFPSLYREVIRRAPQEFKIACLSDIRALFPTDRSPFYAGFGNRPTDEISYEAVGIPKGKIFIINPKGEVAVNAMLDVKSYSSLHELVHDIFPAIDAAQDEHPEREDFNDFNFWKMPLPDIDDDLDFPDPKSKKSRATPPPPSKLRRKDSYRAAGALS